MTNVWSDTLLLMALGMGVVFTFLVVLTLSVRLMSWVIQKMTPTDDRTGDHLTIAAVAAIAYQQHTQSTQK